MQILENITTVCTDYALAGILVVVKQVFTIICIIVPILLIISIAFSLFTLVTNPDRKNGPKPILLKVLAAVLIFFLPTLVNLVMNWLPDNSFNFTTCWQTAEEINKKTTEAVYTEGIPQTGGNSTLMGNLSQLKKYKQQRKNNQSTTNDSDTSSAPKGGMPIPSYYQGDYADVVLSGDKTIASSGCGFTSGAMVASYLTGKTLTPRDIIGSWSRAYYVYNQGMSWEFPKALADHYNLGTVTPTNSAEQVLRALRNNQPVMCSQRPGLFTSGGHIIVLRGVDKSGKVLVNDPNKLNALGKNYNTRAFDMNTEINSTAAIYWIFPQKKKGAMR